MQKTKEKSPVFKPHIYFLTAYVKNTSVIQKQEYLVRSAATIKNGSLPTTHIEVPWIVSILNFEPPVLKGKSSPIQIYPMKLQILLRIIYNTDKIPNIPMDN